MKKWQFYESKVLNFATLTENSFDREKRWLDENGELLSEEEAEHHPFSVAGFEVIPSQYQVG